MVAPADPAATGGPGSGDANTRAENERSADALFESRSLDEIREVRARAARDAEAKDEELRQRVGSSYRDAIATADCVLEMEATAARATETLDEAVRVLTALPAAVASIEKGASARAPETRTTGAPEGTTSSSSSSSSSRDDDALYGAGTRVKFLVDTPEKIWGSLEARDRVGAARRFLAARDVLSVLRAASASSVSNHEKTSPPEKTSTIGIVARAFPIVEQQAPLLESFRAQISRAARVGLADGVRFGNSNLALDVADALAALVAAEDLSAERALRVYLQTRRAWARAALERASVSFQKGQKGVEKGCQGESEDGALGVARALAAVCREARRLPGVLVACFGNPDVFASGDGGFEPDLDDGGFEAGATTSLDDFATLASWGADLDGSSRDGTNGKTDSTDKRARPLLLAATEALDGSPSAATATGTEAVGTATASAPPDAEDEASAEDEAFRVGRDADASSSVETFRGVADPREETERRAARAARRAQTLGAVPMRRDALADAYREWLAGVAEDVAAGGVFGGVASLAALADVERRVEAAEAKDILFGTENKSSMTRADDGSGGVSNQSARAARLGAACERARAALLGAQKPAGEARMAPPASPWASLVEAPHAARARELLKRAFQFAPLRAATEARLSATRAPPRRASPLAPSPEGRALWTEGFSAVAEFRGDDDDDDDDAPSVKRDGVCTTRASREARSARSAPAPPTRRAAERLAQALAQSLARTRRDVVAFAAAAPGLAPGGSRGDGVSVPGRTRAARSAARLARLESFAHAECAAGVKSYAAFLDAKLAALEADAGDAAAERVVLVALAARVAADDAEELAAFLGPSSSWAEEADASVFGGYTTGYSTGARARQRRAAAAARGTVPGGALASTTAALRAVAARGFRAWADGAARAIGANLRAALFADDALSSEERREDWEEETGETGETGETSMHAQEGQQGPAGSGGSGGAARGVRLPALASPYAFGAAHAACAEALRRGGHALPPAAARALAAAAAREALGAYRARLEASRSEGRDGVHRVGEKGALQVLFDARFLYDAFASGSDAASEDDAEARFRADAARANAAALRGVVAAASAALDPIDWATYEVPLWRNVARARARSATVLGLASASEGVSGASARALAAAAKAVAAPAAGGDAAAPPPRFSYLPIGAPAARQIRKPLAFGGSRGNAGLGSASSGSGALLVDWSAAGFDAFGETERPGALSRDGNAGGNFFGKLAGQGLGFIRAL